MLINGATDTEVVQLALDYPVCFVKGRINFDGPNEKSGPTHNSIFVYLGPTPKKFKQVFSKFGKVK